MCKRQRWLERVKPTRHFGALNRVLKKKMHGEIWAKQNKMILDMMMEVNFDRYVCKECEQ